MIRNLKIKAQICDDIEVRKDNGVINGNLEESSEVMKKLKMNSMSDMVCNVSNCDTAVMHNMSENFASEANGILNMFSVMMGCWQSLQDYMSCMIAFGRSGKTA